MKKEVEVNLNAREVKIEDPITFEIKEEVEVVPITFAIKDEIKKLEEMEIIHKKSNLTNVPNLV
jgi:hypothetical protein